MSLCKIAVELQDGTYNVITCRRGATIEGTGLLLSIFYNNFNKVKNLIAYGELIALGAYTGDGPIPPSVKNNMLETMRNATDDTFLVFKYCMYAVRDLGDVKNIEHVNTLDTTVVNYIYRNNEWYVKATTMQRMRKLDVVLKELNVLPTIRLMYGGIVEGYMRREIDAYCKKMGWDVTVPVPVKKTEKYALPKELKIPVKDGELVVQCSPLNTDYTPPYEFCVFYRNNNGVEIDITRLIPKKDGVSIYSYVPEQNDYTGVEVQKWADLIKAAKECE